MKPSYQRNSGYGLRVAIRVDASVDIGIGHVMRCLTLADALKERGAHIRFVSRRMPEYFRDMLAAKGHEFMRLNTSSSEVITDGLSYAHWLGTSQHADAQETVQALSEQTWDWLVADHYGIDVAWERMLRSRARKLMVIDDLANRHHDCDLLLDQNYYRDLGRRYQGLVPNKCVTLLGPAYVLLRPEFADARQRLRVRDGTVRRTLVFFGGSDPTNQTQKVIQSLPLLGRPDIRVDVVVGAANPHRNTIRALCDETPNVAFHCQVSNMAELIMSADLGVGAGGTAMWERCYLGLPTITVVIAANQERTTADVADTGAIEYLGWADQLRPEDYARAIARMASNPQLVKRVSSIALNLLQSVVTPVADAMYSLTTEAGYFRSSDDAVSSGAAQF